MSEWCVSYRPFHVLVVARWHTFGECFFRAHPRELGHIATCVGTQWSNTHTLAMMHNV
jgi:hypothetical protein